MEAVSGRVMVFGTFDVFHPGHESFIEQASAEGEELIIVVARDVTVRRIKPLLRNDEQTRLRVLQEAFPHHEIVLGSETSPLDVVRKYRPSLICLGYDQVGFSKELQEELGDIPIKRLEAFHPDKYKSSKMP